MSPRCRGLRLPAVAVLLGCVALSGCNVLGAEREVATTRESSFQRQGRTYPATTTEIRGEVTGTLMSTSSVIRLSPELEVSCSGATSGEACRNAVERAIAGLRPPAPVPMDGGNDGGAGGHAD